MNSAPPLFRSMRTFLADQERALRATTLAQSSRGATPEIRALYTGPAKSLPDETPATPGDRSVSVSMVGRLTAS